MKLFEFVDTEEFPPYLVMEYVQGESLAELLKRSNVIAARESVALVIPIARALSVAHDIGLVHRDVKPSNILLGDNCQPKVTDFGLALLDDGNVDLTREGALAGTPAYISPEQIVAPHEVDGRTDTSSLGVVLYQMLTGQLPFQGIARMTLLAVMHKEPPSPSQYNDEIPRDVETIVLKSLSKDPDKRYETASAMADDLQRWVDGEPIHARPIGVVERLSRWCKRNPRIARLSATVAALLVTLTVGSVIASLSLSAARDETKAQRDRALNLVESLISEVQERSEYDYDFKASKAMKAKCLQGLREITDREDELGRLNVSAIKAHILVVNSLLWENDFKGAKAHLEDARRLLNKLGGENSAQWPVVELCIELKEFETIYFALQGNNELAEKAILEALRIAEKAHQRWPGDFESHFALAQVQSTILSVSLLDLDDLVNSDEILRTLKEMERKYPENKKVAGLLMDAHYQKAIYAYQKEDYNDALVSYENLLEHYDYLKTRGLARTDQHIMAATAYDDQGQIFKKNCDSDSALKCSVKFMELMDEQFHPHYSLSEIRAVEQYINESKKQLNGHATQVNH